MNSPLASLLDQDLFDLVRTISQEYEAGTLEFLDAHFPSLRARLNNAEEEVGHLRAGLLLGHATLAEWREGLEELRRLWELASQVAREREGQEEFGAVDAGELVGTEA